MASTNTLNLLNYKNCKRCGHPFATVLDYNFCPKCSKESDEKLATVQTYLKSCPTTTIEELSKSCGVTENELITWLREDKIKLAISSPIVLACDMCGERILSGRLCNKCKMQLTAR